MMSAIPQIYFGSANSASSEMAGQTGVAVIRKRTFALMAMDRLAQVVQRER